MHGLPAVHRPKALTLIITYKFARAIGSFLAALVGAVLVIAGLSSPLETWAQELHDNAVSEVALDVTSFVLTAVEPRHLWEVIGALGLDALVLTLEGWALLRGWRWGVWLVVVASAVLVPWEIYALVGHPSVFRAAVLVLNALIVGWLLTHALRKGRTPIILMEERIG